MHLKQEEFCVSDSRKKVDLLWQKEAIPTQNETISKLCSDGILKTTNSRELTGVEHETSSGAKTGVAGRDLLELIVHNDINNKLEVVELGVPAPLGIMNHYGEKSVDTSKKCSCIGMKELMNMLNDGNIEDGH
eukprot:TRINITY_DN8429_c0_g1_i1.p1 TRINITY_DN8429_c0_g1~~TRINITY_DN8429_c0_g1_i1.p1  ORF type:complete len:147 (-),score=21.37 TRINITY_DN8429_c0_g1_i1:19-417(-)